MFVPSDYSDLSDYGAPDAAEMRARIEKLRQRRAKTKRGSKAWKKLTREMQAIQARLDKLKPPPPPKRDKPPLPRARPRPATPRVSSAPEATAVDDDDDDDEPSEVASAEAYAPEEDEHEHDLEVSADVSLDVDAPPLFKRPVFWIGLGALGVAWWKRDTIIRMVKGA